MNHKVKIAILGDSISQGIGKKKVNYIQSLQKKLGEKYEIHNFACTGTTIHYALEQLESIKILKPNIIIIMYGNVDAQIRPNINGKKHKISRIIPKRYKMNGMLDPRPFYSKKWYRKLPDRLDNIARYIIRKIVTKTEGVCQWVPIYEFNKKYKEFLDGINEDNIKIFLVSTIRLDESYYPGCIEQYKVYNESIKLLSKNKNCEYIDLFSYIDNLLIDNEWNDIFYFDHYHPNENGYEFIAELLSNHIISKGDNDE